MKAKAANYPAGSVIAFGGCEFVKNEWRDVPPGKEAEAERHPYLEIEHAEPEPVAIPEPAKPVNKPAPRKRRPRKTAVKAKGSE